MSPRNRKGARRPAGPRGKALETRAAAVSSAEVERRIDEIADLMAAFKWITRVTERELSEAWGVTVSTVQGYSSQASRRVLSSLGDKEQIRARVISGIDRLAVAAASDGEWRTAIYGLAEVARITGIDAPQKVAVTNSAGDDVPPSVLAIAADPVALAEFIATGRLPSRDG